MRIVHDGFAALRIETDDHRVVRVDPHEPGPCDGVVLTGGPWAERYSGSDGSAPTLGPDDLPGSVAGIRVTALPYVAVEPEGGGLDKLRAALRRPRFATGRLAARMQLPDAGPVAIRMEIPHGHVLVHLGLALHRATSDAWLEQAARLCHGAENVVAGYPHGEEEAFVRNILRLRPRRVLVTDQVNDLRKAAGLDTRLVTFARDALVEAGIDAHVVVSGVSMRFETDDTVKRW